MPQPWAARAAAAEDAVITRHLRRLWGLPGTALGVVGWPPRPGERLFGRWHYWWQAQLIDCLIDAQLREPTPLRRGRVVRTVRAQRIHNLGRWTNDYYDDMAWLALALTRAQAAGLVHRPAAVRQLTERILGAWSPEEGGIPWRVGDDFRNTPANGPAAILLARSGHLERATESVDWIRRRLHDEATGLVLDGLHPGRPTERDFYTYCQGVVLGAETEIALRQATENSAGHRLRVHDLLVAISREMSRDKVLRGHGGGNGGLFTGILARYLTVVANRLPGDSATDVAARRLARELVLRSAESAWANAQRIDGLPLFGADWTVAADVPGRGSRPGRRTADGAKASPEAERDLSVQLSGWMLLEAAAALPA